MAKRVDENQPIIVEALRAIGATVEPRMSKLGCGVPDLLVSYHNLTCVMEVKNGNARLTPAEEEWRRNWQGLYFVVRDPQEAVDIIRYHAG